ncbi:hypothetical protein LV92_02864 [Arenibacter echinorum]|uniref:Uncharacterized protein n=1 Tax=Arenibacter echinorum TaxID=440515 RepID=A0A327R240_9FLAO|nr:hypothetical protein LV92_02864 [Arenibacter echinorum]
MVNILGFKRVLIQISQSQLFIFGSFESLLKGAIGSNSELVNMLRIKNIKNK